MKVEEEIHEIINRETQAWNEKNIPKLLSIFHKDMVWVWPKGANCHNPLEWETPQGKFNEIRWMEVYKGLFSSFELIHNNRETLKVEITKQQDGAFAVVDIDTLWRNKETGEKMNWLGRTCKTYSLINPKEWKMIYQVGVLNYSSLNI